MRSRLGPGLECVSAPFPQSLSPPRVWCPDAAGLPAASSHGHHRLLPLLPSLPEARARVAPAGSLWAPQPAEHAASLVFSPHSSSLFLDRRMGACPDLGSWHSEAGPVSQDSRGAALARLLHAVLRAAPRLTGSGLLPPGRRGSPCQAAHLAWVLVCTGFGGPGLGVAGDRGPPSTQ